VHLSALLETDDAAEQGGGNGEDTAAPQSLQLPRSPAAPRDAAANSMLTAITEQRDRFRSANAALEAENAALKKREAALELETRTLRTDNVKMYEKIKFLEAYRPLTGQTLHSVCAVLLLLMLPLFRLCFLSPRLSPPPPPGFCPSRKVCC